MKAGLLGRELLYLVIVAGFIGPAFLAIPVGPIHIFPYRVLLPLLWLIFAMGTLLLGRVDLAHIKVKLHLQFLVCWLLYAVLSLAWALSKADAIRDIIFLFIAASAIFFVVYYFSNSKDLKRFYYLWLAVLGCLLLLGFWEHMTGQHLPVSGYYGETRAGLMFIPTGVSRNPNDYATFLSLSIPFALALTRYARRVSTKALGICMACLGGYLICAVGSRANLIALLLVLGFLFLFLMRSAGRIKVIVVVCACLCVAVLMAPNVVESVSADIGGQLTSIAVQAKANAGSIAVRLNLARNGLSFLVSTGGFGVGGGNAEVWMASRAIYDTRGILNPHNWWLEIIANYGILIFVGYVLFYVNLIWNLWRCWKILSTRADRMIAEALLLSLVGFAIASTSSSSIMALTPQWLLFAFALSFLSYTRLKESVRR